MSKMAAIRRKHEAAGRLPESRASREAGGGSGERTYFLARNGTGVYVDEQTALQYTALWRCVNLISQAMGSLGIGLFRREGSNRVALTGDPLRWLLAGQPCPDMPAFLFREQLTAHVLTWGNGFAEIERNRAGRPVALWPLTPDRVTPERDESGRVYYIVQNAGAQPTTLESTDVFHLRGLSFDGLCGYSPVRLFKNAIGLGVATERYGGAYFGNGSRPGGVLTTDKEVSPETRTKLREDWEAMHRGSDNAGKVAILEDGLKWESVGLPNDVSQFMETRKFQVTELARIYGVPPHKVADLERSTNNNIEHQGIEFVTDGLMPWAKRWEGEADAKLLGRDRMLAGDYVRLNLDSLMRGDSTQRSTFYRSMRDVGAYSVNEIRELEDRDPVEGGDLRLVPMNMVPLDKAGELLNGKTTGAPPPDRGSPPNGSAG